MRRPSTTDAPGTSRELHVRSLVERVYAYVAVTRAREEEAGSCCRATLRALIQILDELATVVPVGRERALCKTAACEQCKVLRVRVARVALVAVICLSV